MLREEQVGFARKPGGFSGYGHCTGDSVPCMIFWSGDCEQLVNVNAVVFRSTVSWSHALGFDF